MAERKYRYSIEFPGDASAGLRSFSDRITVVVDSGDPGGEEGEFVAFIKDALSEWYDGAYVEKITESEYEKGYALNDWPQPDEER